MKTIQEMTEAMQLLADHFDLMIDEFKRIKALTKNTEIQGLCDRAITNTKQHVPVIAQRDEWEQKFWELDKQWSERYAELEKASVTGVTTSGRNVP